MCNQVELLEATLDRMDEAIAILDDSSKIVFWNSAAAALTGYASQEVIGRACPDFYSFASASENRQSGKPTSTALNHRSGHTVPGMLRTFTLQNSQLQPAGKAFLFYPIEQLEPATTESSICIDLERSHEEMADRIEAAHHQWMTAGIPFGLLRIAVDQTESLRSTHGREACESMLRTVEQTLSRQMKPAEVIGHWGGSEFLVLTHERTTDLLLEHARRLAGVARTADFRWWGDRVNLTVSIGVAVAEEGYTLRALLDAALDAMHSAIYAGGNQVVHPRGI